MNEYATQLTVSYVYFLIIQATDDDGFGQSTVVSLQISLTDSNDNPPVFVTPVYKASIDEDAVKFEPELQVNFLHILGKRCLGLFFF